MPFNFLETELSSDKRVSSMTTDRASFYAQARQDGEDECDSFAITEYLERH